MPDSYDLTQLDPNSFENLVNMLLLRVLGPGTTGFGPGSDGGRDGYFTGEAPYPSATERWSGVWYIQSKFHKPHLSKNPQKWLLEQIDAEIKAFSDPQSGRGWPDIWIVATNVDPSGKPQTGAFDQARKKVKKARPALESRFAIWGGRKILNLLTLHEEVAAHYRHFLTPGHVLTQLYEALKARRNEIETILRFLIVKQFDQQQHTRLEQAGSGADQRPGIHRLFIDLPCRATAQKFQGMAMKSLVRTAASYLRVGDEQALTQAWTNWRRQPPRARVWFLRGGPGQGKSTIGQYFCQIQRAALILAPDGPEAPERLIKVAAEVREAAERSGYWPSSPRIPIAIELKDFAHWYGRRNQNQARGVRSYLAERFAAGTDQAVETGTLREALKTRSWFVAFDGLDEVPNDVKDEIAREVRDFVEDALSECHADLLILCTSRPQGYSGQFSDLNGTAIDLVALSPTQALACARPVVETGLSESEARSALENLAAAIEGTAVRELMTTPLQAHIMAVVVRDGGRPPERKWQLFDTFYEVIRRREANKNLPNTRLARLLRDRVQLLKSIHSRLGFVLHAKAETSGGAQTHLTRIEFRQLAREVVQQRDEASIDVTVDTLMEATIDRLVLVSTPDNGDHVRFDVRPLQEFFASAFLYERVHAQELRDRLALIAGDAHWREVMHFLLSALVENDRRTELSVAISVLQELDDGDGESWPRVLCRRLARGAILAAKLLYDGVLEQDLRTRQEFRKVIEPLFTVTSASGEMIRYLGGVGQEISRGWVLSVLGQHLREATVAESRGAACALMMSLRDGDELTEEVGAFFLSAPPELLAALLNMLHLESVPQWLLLVMLQRILRDDWFELRLDGIFAILRYLRINLKTTHAVAKRAGLPRGHRELLSALFWEPWAPSHSSSVVEYCEHDWTTESFNMEPWGNELPDGLFEATGILQLAYRVLRVGKEKNAGSLEHLREYLTQVGTRMLLTLPPNIRAFAPTTDNVCNLVEPGAYDSWHAPRPVAFVVLHGDRPDWVTMLKARPSAYETLLRSERQGVLKAKKSLQKAIVDAIKAYPEGLLSVVGKWGLLLSVFSHRQERLEIRKLIIDASAAPVRRPDPWRRHFFERVEFHSFLVSLPNEAVLLPHIIGEFGSVVDPSFDRAPSEVARSITSNDGALKRLVANQSVDQAIRAASLLMLLFLGKAGRSGDRERKLVECYGKEIGYWYLPAVGLYFARRRERKAPDAVAREVVDSLLERARDDHDGSVGLESLLNGWRERSASPVTATNALDVWLEGRVSVDNSGTI
jgi:hypothetical protein